MKKMTWIAGLILTGAAVLFTGCRSQEDYDVQRAENTLRDLERAQWSKFKADHEYSLSECIALAMESNLDIKVAELESEVAGETKIAEALGMLPELTIANTTSYRNNTAASSSEQINGRSGAGTYSYSTSTDKDLNYLNVDLALSVLDFGLAWLNTSQAQDRQLMREQRTRRTAQNLQMEVVRAYFQVAAAQKAIKITNDLLEKCQSRYTLIQEMAKKRLITPFRAFDETRRFVEMEKRLTNYTRSYENSQVELCSLMGMASSSIVVDDSLLNVAMPPVFNLPEIGVMEQIALLERPEMYELDMQRHVNVLELYKTIVMMFPNARMYMDFTNSTNGFLYHHNWMEIGLRAAYNLLKLPQQIFRARSYYKQIEAEDARTLSQAIGVMAQVRIANANLLSTQERFQIDNRIYTAYSENLKAAEASIKTAGGLSQLELDHIRLSTAETEIERLMTLGNCYVSYYRLLNTLGIDPGMEIAGNEEFLTKCQNRLKAAEGEADEELAEAWEEAKNQGWENIPEAAPVSKKAEEAAPAEEEAKAAAEPAA